MSRAVIVVDMLKGFCESGNLASARLAGIIGCIRDMLDRELAAGSDIIFLADTHNADDPEFDMFPPHCVAGSGEEEVVAELAPYLEKAALVRKNRYSGFHGTELESLLAELSPEEVLVAGVCTDICVMHTVADLRNRDYRVTVVADCVETYDAPGHPADDINRFALEHMRDILGATISS